MSTMTANGTYHAFDSTLDGNPSPASPTSPTSTLQSQSRSFSGAIRGQNSPFPSTPTSGLFSSSLDPPPGLTYAEYIRKWDDTHVSRWLTDIKCANQIPTFKANDIRGDILLELDQTTLQEMGVSSIGDRLRILNAVKALRQKAHGRPVSSISSASSHRTSKLSVELTPGELAANNANRNPDTGPGGTTRLATRRLESGRPTPLQLTSSTGRNDLPRLVRDAQQPPDSARSGTSTSSSQNQHIRPLPQPSQTSAAPSSSTTSAGTPSTTYSAASSTASRNNLPPLPPPPRGQPPLPPPTRAPVRSGVSSGGSVPGRRTPTQNESSASTGLLTPSSSSTWGLPSDPRPGNPGGGKPAPSGGRSTSPLPPPRTRNVAANPVHARNASLGVGSPGTSPGKTQQRSLGSSGHPYANQAGLQPPSSRIVDLSPIQEHFGHANGTSSTTPPSYGSRPPQTTAPSLDDLRRKLVRFILPEEGQTFTIDVDTCAGGVEIIEKVLRKFGKGGSRSADSDSEVQMDEGALTVDGWCVYMDDAPNEPLDEAQLLSVCHAPVDHPARERPLILRRASRSRADDRSDQPFLDPPDRNRTKRASAVSILSDLGVRHPEQALEPSSPTSGRMSPANLKRPSKLRNFFGQRPPSELITNYLTEYFPNTEKKVLERTARHSMMLRSNTLSMSKRDSAASWIPPLPSRFSSSTQGSQSRTSLVSATAPSLNDGLNSDGSVVSLGEDIPRVSLSTEDGRALDLGDNVPSTTDHPQLLPPIPFPSESLSDSVESITSGLRVSRPVSRAMSNASRASRRMSYMTELRSKRDRSDTASLLTVDQITAEVESRQESQANTAVDRGSDTEEWTKVGSDGDDEEEETEVTDQDGDEDGLDEDEGTLNDGDEEEFAGKVKMRKANKWIKGALIGAGSFGKVYLGMDASNGLLMAVKQVELPTGSASNQERKKSMITALEREIELLQDLQHENIVQYLYSSLEDDCLNIFLEYVPGGSVAALLRSYGAFEEPLVKNFVRQILQGLNYLHERDIIHRDIKGANILVDNKGGVKISDFGISKKVDVQVLAGNRAHRPSLQGSVFWMAPEVVKQSGHTFKADIWSVGCLVVEMLTGEHPWAQLTQMQAIFKIGSSAKPAIPTDISSDAQDFLSRTFELNHEARPSAENLLQHSFISQSKGSNAQKSV